MESPYATSCKQIVVTTTLSCTVLERRRCKCRKSSNLPTTIRSYSSSAKGVSSYGDFYR